MTLLAFAKHWISLHVPDKCTANSLMQLCTVFVAQRHSESSWSIVIDYFCRMLADYEREQK